jgi:excinuclease ABC subunit C
VSHALEDAALVEEWLAARRGQRVTVYRPERGEKARLLDMALHNAGAELERLPARREAGDLPERLQRRLGLSRAPRRIEFADNSTLMGSEPVAGVVVFVDGRPETSAYRTYRIRTVNGPDDYAAMTEVLERRYRDAGGQGALPDLLMVDGGRGQLGVALAVMRELGLEGRFDVIGIAKKDERRGESRDKIFVPGRANPVAFGRDADALLFLQRVRDEAHRFAIAYHRRRRRRAALRSALDRLPGIGASRKAALIRHFRSFEAIRAATLEELSALPGFNLGLAEAVKAGLAAAAPAEDEPASTSASPEPP